MNWRFPQLSDVWSQGFRGFKLFGEKVKRAIMHHQFTLLTGQQAKEMARQVSHTLSSSSFQSSRVSSRASWGCWRVNMALLLIPSESRTDSLNSNSSGVLDWRVVYSVADSSPNAALRAGRCLSVVPSVKQESWVRSLRIWGSDLLKDRLQLEIKHCEN